LVDLIGTKQNKTNKQPSFIDRIEWIEWNLYSILGIWIQLKFNLI
jgi:hypothetical protein